MVVDGEPGNCVIYDPGMKSAQICISLIAFVHSDFERELDIHLMDHKSNSLTENGFGFADYIISLFLVVKGENPDI